MYERINFLRERVRIQEAVLQSDKRIALVTSIGLGIFLMSFVAIVGYRFLLASQIQAAKVKADAADATITSLKSVQNAYLLRKNMLSLTSQVIEKRTKAWDAIKYLYTVIPTESKIDSINLSGTDGSLEFTVKSPSIVAYKVLSESLQSDQVAKSGFRPQLGSLSRDKKGAYALQVRLFMSAAPKAAATTSPSVQP